MTEAIIAKEIQPTLYQENPVLAERLSQMMREPEIHQENFHSRKEWESKAKEALLETGATIIFLDVAGGGKLAKNENLIPTIQAITNAISAYQENQENSMLTLGRRRQIATQERVVGSDEILILIRGKLNKEEIEKEIETLKEQLKKNTKRKNSVYIGVCSAVADTPLDRVLRGADIALKRAKELAKSKKKDFRHQVVTITSDQAFLNGSPLNPSQLEKKALSLAKEVQFENVIEKIRKELGNNKKLTIISPKGMKEINKKYGMDGGDWILAEISKVIVRSLGTLIEKLPISIYKVGSMFIIAANEKIPSHILNKIAQETVNEASLNSFTNISLDFAFLSISQA